MKFDAREFTLNVLKQQTKRDKQVKVGASNFSQPCARCLADDLTGVVRPQGPYWAGATIGTAIHGFLEGRLQDDSDVLSERRVVLGELVGYGTVKSTLDLFHIPSRTVVDFKTTTKDKLKFIKRALATAPDPYEVSKITDTRYKTDSYRNQLHTYGGGLTNEGYEVDSVALVFVCRDASTDTDIWGWDEPYNPERKDAVWDRLEKLWAWLQDGGNPEDLTSAPGCYYCSTMR